MLPVTQIDTFYNGLTLRNRDTINVVAGRTFMKRRPEECYGLIENMTAHHNDWDTSVQQSESSSSITSSSDLKIVALKAEMAKINKNLIKVFQINQQVKAVTPSCETCSGPHSYNNCPATISLTQNTNMTSLTNSNLELKNMFGQFMKMNTTSSSGSGTLRSNTVTNPKEDLKGITTRSGNAYQGPTIPTTSSSPHKVVERETEVTKDTVPPANNESTKDVQPPIIQVEIQIPNSEPVVAPVRDILLLEAFLHDDPSLTPPTQGMYLPQIQKELTICKAKNDKSSIDEPSEVELKDLPPHLEYAFLEGDDKLPVIIAKDLSVEEITALIKVLKSHKSRKYHIHVSSWNVLLPLHSFRVMQCTEHVPKVYDGHLSLYDQKTIEVFMDDFSIFRNSFGTCLSHLDKMLQWCEDTNLCLNWEKSHFMAKEGIVLGHKISKNEIEVDKAKVDVIAKLPHPIIVNGIRSFLAHAGFYRRFIQDYSKIARPMTRLLEKDTLFFFSKEYVEAFQTLKKKLTEAPILVTPDWDMPFELMCDASDFAIGVVLGQRKTKHFQPIHYASKTMTDAQAHYTTMEKNY
nr:reverse transcriptase domain-containing protein [Tanacetum cinerariifolium]